MLLAGSLKKTSVGNCHEGAARITLVVGTGGSAMMGERRVDQSPLFYEFSLERHVSTDRILRAI